MDLRQYLIGVIIAHPVFLDTRLAGFNLTGSGERGCEDVGEADGDGGRGSAEALECGTEGGDRASAATAGSHGLTVLTRNLRYFAPLGIPANDPFERLP